MNTRLILLTAMLCLPLSAMGRQEACDSSRVERYDLALYGRYGYNATEGHTGGFDLTSRMPINKYFEVEAAFEFHSPKVCALTAVARPRFPLPVGELFLDGAFHLRYMGAYGIGDFTTAGSIGYRMDYVSAQVGLSNHTIIDFEKPRGSTSENISEPFNLIYRLDVRVRPHTSCWNIHLGFSNFTMFEYERSWQPIIFLGGHYDINNDFTVLLETELKNSGINNCTGRFWGVNVRAGVKYEF